MGPYRFEAELGRGAPGEDRLRRGPLDTRDLIEIGRQAVTRPAAAHSRGIVHRALEPANERTTAELRND